MSGLALPTAGSLDGLRRWQVGRAEPSAQVVPEDRVRADLVLQA